MSGRALPTRGRFLAGSSLALTAAFGARPVPAQNSPAIRVSGPTQEGFKTVYYGVRAGVFQKYGVAVEIVQSASGAAALAALAGGSVDVALTSLVPFFQAYARALPFQIVAPGQQYVSSAVTQGLFVKKDSPIKRGSDLHGKIVAVQSIKDLNWAGTRAWVDATGGDSSQVQFIELGLAAVLPAIVEGRVDAGLLSAPYLQQGIAAGTVRMVAAPFDVVAKQFEVAVYISTKEYVATHIDAMRRFARAMQESAIYVNTHPAQTVDLIASFTGVAPAVIAQAVRTTDPAFVDTRGIQPVINLAYKYKLLEHPISAEELIAPTALRSGPR